MCPVASIADQLKNLSLNLLREVFDMTIERKNKVAAKNQLNLILNINSENTDFEVPEELDSYLRYKYQFLKAELETQVETKVISMRRSLKNIHRSTLTSLEARYFLFKIGSELENHSDSIYQDKTFKSAFDLKSSDTALEDLQMHNINILRDISESSAGNDGGKYYTSLGKYCYDLICGQSPVDTSILCRNFIGSILKAMTHGSLEATHYFPCLLKLEYYETQEIKDSFVSNCENVPTWLFLNWQTQIMSCLGNHLRELVIPLVQRLVQVCQSMKIHTTYFHCFFT